MTRVKTLVLCAMMALLVTPGAADAFSWWKLDKLSGPEFEGVGLGIRVKCWVTAAPGAPPPDQPAAKEPSGGLIFSLCPRTPRRQHSVNLEAAWFYSEEDPVFANGFRIYFWSLGGSFTSRINEVFELGAGVHAARFYSRGIVESFEKVMLEPIRADIRPLQNRWRFDPYRPPSAWWREAIVVRTGVLWFPEGFDAGEFNAEPDEDSAVPYIGFYLDLGF